MNREHAIEVATDTLMKRYKGIRKVLLRADAKAVVNRLVYLEDARIAELTAEVASVRSKLSRMEGMAEELIDLMEIPAPSCTCCISPPCCDCVDWAGARELVDTVKRAIARNALKDGV